MPKLIPVADALSKPFWDAVNQRRLVLQHCAACDRLQYPPQQACQVCNSAAGLTWKEVEGRGHIATYIVIEDGRLNRRMPDQPYNLAMVTLDADPRVNFYSNLPGTPPYKVPVGAAVEVTFEEVAPGQLIHEWRVVALVSVQSRAIFTRSTSCERMRSNTTGDGTSLASEMAIASLAIDSGPCIASLPEHRGKVEP